MDRKTLEYMEERAKKAREIVKEIDSLSNNIDKITKIETVRFLNHNWHSEFDSSTGDLTNELKEFYIQTAEQKIEWLEQKLAEL